MHHPSGYTLSNCSCAVEAAVGDDEGLVEVVDVVI